MQIQTSKKKFVNIVVGKVGWDNGMEDGMKRVCFPTLQDSDYIGEDCHMLSCTTSCLDASIEPGRRVRAAVLLGS